MSLCYYILLFILIGWSHDMRDKIYRRPKANLPDLQSFVEFNPSSTSYFCRNAVDGTLCEPVTFRAYTGAGSFLVKIFSGDPHFDSILNLTINGKVIITDQHVEKNVLYTREEVIEAKNGLIEFTSECLKNCDYAISKLNAIEFQKFEDHSNHFKEESSSVIKLCGNGFKGGMIINILIKIDILYYIIIYYKLCCI